MTGLLLLLSLQSTLSISSVLAYQSINDDSGRGFSLPMLDLAAVKEDLEQRTDIGFQNLVSLGLALLALGLWVTIVVIVVQRSYTSNSRADYTSEIEYYKLPETAVSSWAAVLDYLTPDSLDKINNSIPQRSANVPAKAAPRPRKPVPAVNNNPLSRGGSSSVSPAASSSVSSAASSLAEMAQGLLKMSSSVTGGIERVASDTNIQDCILQTVCYLSAPDSNAIENRYLRHEVEGRRTKNNKNKKNKKENEEEDLSSTDCEVFNCTAVTVGHNVLTLYRKLSELTSRISDAE